MTMMNKTSWTTIQLVKQLLSINPVTTKQSMVLKAWWEKQKESMTHLFITHKVQIKPNKSNLTAKIHLLKMKSKFAPDKDIIIESGEFKRQKTENQRRKFVLDAQSIATLVTLNLMERKRPWIFTLSMNTISTWPIGEQLSILHLSHASIKKSQITHSKQLDGLFKPFWPTLMSLNMLLLVERIWMSIRSMF